MKQEIYKLQRPLMGGKELLLYNEDKSIISHLPPQKDLLKMFGNDLKIYVLGHFDQKDIFHIEKQVKQQDW